jgi:hypothetical protein
MRNAVFWCSESDFLRMREIMSDRDDWPITYAEWDANIDQGVASAAARGMTLTKVKINPDEFTVWCHINARAHDTNSRSIYSAVKFSEAPPPSN